MLRLRNRFVACLSALTLFGCVAASRPDENSADSQLAVELLLAKPDRRPLRLSSLRGQPTLVFFFATYDSASQLALGHLERFLAHEPRITALGIALQPDARDFLEPYRDALSVGFELTYDPENVVLQGKSDFGDIPSVPTFIMLDAGGHVRAKHVGVATDEQLQDLVSEAL